MIIDGNKYSLNITYKDILRVREKTDIDLCYIAETGDFSKVNSKIDNVVNVVYWLLFDKLNANYSHPKEARNAFEESITGELLEVMVREWIEGVINFIPVLAVREAARTALIKRTQAEALATIEMIMNSVGIGQREKSGDALESSD